MSYTISPCDHKFIGSTRCLKCGWEPNATAIASRLEPMHVVASKPSRPGALAQSAEPVVTRAHREMAVAAFNDEPITPLFMCRWIDGGCSGFSQAQSRLASIAKALVTVEHNARREAEPKWVATAERMPKAERSVLIMGHGWPAPVVADLIVDIADGTPTCWSDKYQGGGVYWLDDVTHWMPLPPPPPGGASDV